MSYATERWTSPGGDARLTDAKTPDFAAQVHVLVIRFALRALIVFIGPELALVKVYRHDLWTQRAFAP